ncbi:hypothetical protein DYD21_17010 [Rhodohalobacter sp. SW132]|uniref:hypothetical protein n=1 Tax=Rhodohalobacter sp. SW132 TaxID=2293433 RepID=UPI000E2299F1|nr:hypothetical protein [Rhodohalobacter sp. SW132]REL24857.1 hypothetical protein DYD21_17010 [Rhodohalobacter sp. SW132]
MNRKFLLAAETFRYSFNKYADKLEVRAERFLKIMPSHIDILEKSEQENWPLEKLADAMDTDTKLAEFYRREYGKAKEIVNAPNPAESFRRGVRHSIQHAVHEGLKTDEDIEKLVIQICYRAADLSYLLDQTNQKLSVYSENFRKTPDNLDLLEDI